jgi:hypothetical protein
MQSEYLSFVQALHGSSRRPAKSSWFGLLASSEHLEVEYRKSEITYF